MNMKKDYLIFVICCLLYVALSAIDLFFIQVDTIYLTIGSIFVWGTLCFIAIKNMILVDKTSRRFKHYLFVLAASLVLLSIVIRAIMR